MEDDLAELLRLVFERDLEVLLPEEFGVGEAGGQDLFVAGDDAGAAVGGFDVGGADEMGAEAPLPVQTGEIFLVGPHGEPDHLGRDLEEGGVEAAEERHRPFGEAGILGEQAFILDQGEAGGGGGGAGALGNEAAALGGIGDDVAGLELFKVIVGAADGDDAGVMEAVADGGGAGAHAGDLNGHDLLAEQGDDALQGSDPAQAFGRGGGVAPAHRLGPGKGADDCGDGFGQDGDGGAAGLVEDGEVHAVALDELVRGEAGLAQEAFQGLGRCGGAGAFGFLPHGRGFGGEAPGDEREAAGGGAGFHGLRGEAGGGELLGEQAGEIGRRPGLHAGGDFLGEEFEEEVGHAAAIGERENEKKGKEKKKTLTLPSPAKGGRGGKGVRGPATSGVWTARAGPFSRLREKVGMRVFLLPSLTLPIRSFPSRRRRRLWRDRGRGLCTPGVRRRR